MEIGLHVHYLPFNTFCEWICLLGLYVWSVFWLCIYSRARMKVEWEVAPAFRGLTARRATRRRERTTGWKRRGWRKSCCPPSKTRQSSFLLTGWRFAAPSKAGRSSGVCSNQDCCCSIDPRRQRVVIGLGQSYSAPVSSLNGQARKMASASSCSTQWTSQFGQAKDQR